MATIQIYEYTKRQDTGEYFLKYITSCPSISEAVTIANQWVKKGRKLLLMTEVDLADAWRDEDELFEEAQKELAHA